MYLVLRVSLKDGIPPRMAIPCPVTAIRHLKWVALSTLRTNLLANHLPTTLRRLWFISVQIAPDDLGTLLRRIPPDVRDLAIENLPLGNDMTEDLARAFPPALTHLRLVMTDIPHRGLMAVIDALPADQIVSLDLGKNLPKLETMNALANWLRRTTRLEHLALENAYFAIA
ncbi:hypothetical protein GGF32_000584 [Allomyces javanicus]|nr:hypothetical protein GGF32_000584 [Allomyces javanicus]